MKTVNLSKESLSVDELLTMAREKSVLLVSADGTTYFLEEADDFDREVAVLGNSDRFLKKRSKEKSVVSIEELAEELSEKMHKPMQPTRSAAKPRRSSEEHTSELQSRGHLVCR